MPASCYSLFLQRVGEQLAVLFPLTEGESQSTADAAADYSCNHAGSLLLGDDSSKWLVSTSGVTLSGSGRSDRLTSTFSLDTLLQRAAAADRALDGWSVEVWILPATSSEVNAIMTIGTVESTGSVEQYAPMPAGSSLVLLQDSSTYTFLVQLDSGGGTQYALAANMPTSFDPQPYSVRVDDHSFHLLSPDATPVLAQLVLVLNSTLNTMDMFVNGQLATTLIQPFDSPLSTWFTNSSFLSFAQTSSSTAIAPHTWSGSIRLLAMYSSSLSPASVQMNWIAGLPPDVPQPPAITNVSWSWPQPYFSINVSTTSPVLVTIRSLPVQGVLAIYNGSSNTTSVLTVSQLPFQLNATTVVTFRYWPPAGLNASYVTDFNYTLAAPSAPLSPSNPGSVSFFVALPIAPPLPINQSLQAVAQVPLIVQLNGVDEDMTGPAAAMSAAYVVSLPAYGHLLQVNTDDSFGPLISPSALPALVADSQLRVWYVSNPGSLTLSSKPVVLPLDSFSFTVEVKGAVSTVVGTVSLTVNNSMTALNSSTVLYDSNATLVSTSGSDAINETFTYTVLTVPIYGVLLDAGNATVIALTPFLPPVYYQSSQQRDSGRYDRTRMPLPDSFTFATVSATGVLSVPATASVTFAPALGPPLLLLNPPADPTSIVISNPVNFSAIIDPAGLSDPLTTTWLVTLDVSPATGQVATNWSDGMGGLESAVVMDVNEPETVQFEAITDDANLLLSHLTFQSTIVNTYTITLTVQNGADHNIQTVASVTVTTIPTLTTASSGNVSGLLPFNALYLWLTVGILVALIVLALCIRRCVSDKDREPVMTNEERHILNKVRANAGLGVSAGERLDGGIMRTSSAGGAVAGGDDGVVDEGKARKNVKPSSDAVDADAEEKQQSVSGLIGLFGGGQGRRAMKLTPSVDEALGMTSVLPRAPEASHLGSRIDTELWGLHVGGHAMLPQPQHRGVQLIPTGDSSQLSGPFDPYATANLVPYEAMQTQPLALSVTQMLSSSLTDSQLLAGAPIIEQPVVNKRVPRVLTPTASSDAAPQSMAAQGQDDVMTASQSRFRLLHAAHTQPIRRSLTSANEHGAGLLDAYSSAGVLASPRLNTNHARARDDSLPTAVNQQAGSGADDAQPMKQSGGSAKSRFEERTRQQTLNRSPLIHRRARTAASVELAPLPVEDVDNTPPAAKRSTVAQPHSSGVLRASSSAASSMPRGRLMRPRWKSNAEMAGGGIEVPVNPMVPVKGDTPRYRPEVYNTLTRRRQLSISRGSSTASSQRDSVSSDQADEEVLDSINRQHSLFEHNRMRSLQQPSVDEEEEGM